MGAVLDIELVEQSDVDGYVRVTNFKVDFDLFVKTFKEFPPR